MALALLDRLIAEFPDPFQLAPGLALRAEVLVDLGRADEALRTYERALAARRAFPQVGDDGHIGYAELVIALRRRELYESALAAIKEFSDEVQFPVQEFRIAATRALIAAEREDSVAATVSESTISGGSAFAGRMAMRRRLQLLTTTEESHGHS